MTSNTCHQVLMTKYYNNFRNERKILKGYQNQRQDVLCPQPYLIFI
jgi:hypothetical protein